MKNTGIVRKIDKLGRLVIPKETRDMLGWEIGTPIEMYLERDNVILAEYKIKCAICGNEEKLSDFMGTKICTNCIEQIKGC